MLDILIDRPEEKTIKKGILKISDRADKPVRAISVFHHSLEVISCFLNCNYYCPPFFPLKVTIHTHNPKKLYIWGTLAIVPDIARFREMTEIAKPWSYKMANGKEGILRKSFPGIVLELLALSRAFGETMVVLMVCGNIPLIPHSFFDACYPLPAVIANNYGEMLTMPSYESALCLRHLCSEVVFQRRSRLILIQIERRYNIHNRLRCNKIPNIWKKRFSRS